MSACTGVPRYEVHEEGPGWAVVYVDSFGHRFLIADYPDAIKAHLRATYLARKVSSIPS